MDQDPATVTESSAGARNAAGERHSGRAAAQAGLWREWDTFVEPGPTRDSCNRVVVISGPLAA